MEQAPIHIPLPLPHADRPTGGGPRSGADPASGAAVAPTGGRSVGPATWAFIALSAVGFAGGLLVAVFCFNTPDHAITVAAAHEPELIYTRPADATSTVVQFDASSSREVEGTADASTQNAAGGEFASITTDAEPHRSDAVDLGSDAAIILAQAPLPEATANFAAAERLGFVASAINHTGSDAITAGYSAEELPSIPEPGSGVAIAAGAVILLGAKTLTRKRRSQS